MGTIHYFSQCFRDMKKYNAVWGQIENALNQQNATYDFIPNANDIWARDFMPFQRHDGEFVIYRYNPDYLKKRPKYITNCRDAFLDIGGKDALSSSICHHTNLVIDGGNIIQCSDNDGTPCIIMTTKVLYENKGWSHHEILMELDEIFNAEVILIPWDIAEKYGHADGMIRSIGKGQLLMNCYTDMDSELGEVLKKALANRFELHELHYGDKFQENSWCHLNYLELYGAVLVPVANLASDSLALKQIEEILGKKCIPISMASVIAEGGAMHCISWSMDTHILFEHEIVFGHPMLCPQC